MAVTARRIKGGIFGVHYVCFSIGTLGSGMMGIPPCTIIIGHVIRAYRTGDLSALLGWQPALASLYFWVGAIMRHDSLLLSFGN